MSKRVNKERVVTPEVEETLIQEEEVKVPVIEEIKSSAKIGVVTHCKALNFRKGPNTKAEIISVLDEARIVKVLDVKNDFYKVETADGKIGYCMKKFIDVEE